MIMQNMCFIIYICAQTFELLQCFAMKFKLLRNIEECHRNGIKHSWKNVLVNVNIVVYYFLLCFF